MIFNISPFMLLSNDLLCATNQKRGIIYQILDEFRTMKIITVLVPFNNCVDLKKISLTKMDESFEHKSYSMVVTSYFYFIRVRAGPKIWEKQHGNSCGPAQCVPFMLKLPV